MFPVRLKMISLLLYVVIIKSAINIQLLMLMLVLMLPSGFFGVRINFLVWGRI